MLLRKSYEKNPFTAFIEKKSTSKWTFVVQTYVVQGSAVLQPPLHCLPCPPRRTPPTPTSMLKGDYRGFQGLFAPFWLNNCLYGLVQAGAVEKFVRNSRLQSCYLTTRVKDRTHVPRARPTPCLLLPIRLRSPPGLPNTWHKVGFSLNMCGVRKTGDTQTSHVLAMRTASSISPCEF